MDPMYKRIEQKGYKQLVFSFSFPFSRLFYTNSYENIELIINDKELKEQHVCVIVSVVSMVAK